MTITFLDTRTPGTGRRSDGWEIWSAQEGDIRRDFRRFYRNAQSIVTRIEIKDPQVIAAMASEETRDLILSRVHGWDHEDSCVLPWREVEDPGAEWLFPGSFWVAQFSLRWSPEKDEWVYELPDWPEAAIEARGQFVGKKRSRNLTRTFMGAARTCLRKDS